MHVSDLTQTVEELEEDLITLKSGGKIAKKPRKRPPGSPSGGYHVTFDSTVGLEKEDGEKLGPLIKNAKERCVVLERQIRYNTSVLKSTQHRNETLSRDREELERQNCHLRRYLTD